MEPETLQFEVVRHVTLPHLKLKDKRGNGAIIRYTIVLEDGSQLIESAPNASRYYHAADKAATS